MVGLRVDELGWEADGEIYSGASCQADGAVGTSTHSRSFNEEIIREMVGMPDGIVRNKADSRQAKHVERPIIVSTSRWGKAEVLMIT